MENGKKFSSIWLLFASLGACTVQILLIFLQKMDLLLTKTPAEDIKNSVLPMVYRALEAPSVQIQVRGREMELIMSAATSYCMLVSKIFLGLFEISGCFAALTPHLLKWKHCQNSHLYFIGVYFYHPTWSVIFSTLCTRRSLITSRAQWDWMLMAS